MNQHIKSDSVLLLIFKTLKFLSLNLANHVSHEHQVVLSNQFYAKNQIKDAQVSNQHSKY